MIFYIEPNGLLEVIDNVKGEPTLKQLYSWINCDTVEVPGGGLTVEGEEIQFVVDEEGKLAEKPVNLIATTLYNSVLLANGRVTGRDTLNGTVVVLTGRNLLK